jgi:serine/threonine-protein kinase RsbW
MCQSRSFQIRNLPGALETLRGDLERTVLGNLNRSSRALVLLVVDELVSNLIKYGFTNDKEEILEFRIAISDEWLEIDWKDNGRPFNPIASPKPTSLTDDLDARQPGGLGVYLVLNMVDESRYNWTPPWNCLNLRKRIGNDEQ